MFPSTSEDLPTFPPNGEHWVVWDRSQTRILGHAHTFQEAKRTAAAAGERSVLLAKMPPKHRSFGGRRLIYMVAVFLSQLSGAAMV